MPKGSKTCPNCGATCGPRTFICPSCKHEFAMKRKEKVVITPGDVGNLNDILQITENTPAVGVAADAV